MPEGRGCLLLFVVTSMSMPSGSDQGQNDDDRTPSTDAGIFVSALPYLLRVLYRQPSDLDKLKEAGISELQPFLS